MWYFYHFSPTNGLMGILSASVSITRYHIEGKLKAPILDTIAQGLEKNKVTEIDGDSMEKASGWTSFQHPYQPDFKGSSFVYGNYLVFSLRLDKKNISPKILQKHFMMESASRLAATGRQYLSRSEKKQLRDLVNHDLSLKIPATPYVYDLIWDYEASALWFFTNLKAANEELETLFTRSFGLTLIRLFPFTTAERMRELTDQQKDTLAGLTPTNFVE